MLKELLGLFRTSDSITAMGRDFSEMLGVAREITAQAGAIFFGETTSDEARIEISKRDVAINKLERGIRKKVVAHLTLGAEPADVTYCLLLMSIVKDVERIGDYAKNLAEVHHEGGAAIPDDATGDELREIRTVVERMLDSANDVFTHSDADTARKLIAEGRELNQRCDALIATVARSQYDAATTTSLVLGARYYKRIESHLLNLLSGIVMPIHKLDYLDEPRGPDDADEE